MVSRHMPRRIWRDTTIKKHPTFLIQPMLIYAHTVSTRLQYICNFIFKEQLGIGFSLTIDSEGFKSHQGPKINYSSLDLDGGDIFEA